MSPSSLHTFVQRFPRLCTPRPRECHKGDFGHLALLGGSPGFSGALVLASTAAVQLGAGRVSAVFCEEKLPQPYLVGYPEVMLATSNHVFSNENVDCWVIGCGLGTSAAAAFILARTIKHCAGKNQPLLLDADALNLLARDADLSALLARNANLHVLTPHPAEAGRLLGVDAETVQRDRRAAALELVQRFHAWIVLKGCRTLIASPEGQLWENDSGNAALASGGSGDVLAGMLGALLAQRLPPEEALPGGVWLHGAAADSYNDGPVPLIGLRASELAPAVRRLRQQATLLALNHQEKP